MYIDWDSYAVMGIKTMKSFSRPRGECCSARCVFQLHSLNVSRFFKANSDGCELSGVDCERVRFVGKVDGNVAI
jgi:hypothetical protein